MVGRSPKWNLHATAKQMVAITRLAMRLGIREEIEQQDMTRQEARAMLQSLRKRLEAKDASNNVG